MATWAEGNRSRKAFLHAALAVMCSLAIATPSLAFAQEGETNAPGGSGTTLATQNAEHAAVVTQDAERAAAVPQDAETSQQPAAATQQSDATVTSQGATTAATQQSGELTAATQSAAAQPSTQSNQQQAVTYDYNATPYGESIAEDGTQVGDGYAGVYVTKLDPNSAPAASAPTIGMPSIADANLKDTPTTESPAIIQGAAVGYEEKTGPVDYTTLKERPEPYSEFKLDIVQEQGQDGAIHKKLTGFDGTYVITRLDVSQFFDGRDLSTSYLHVKQEDNNALLVSVGMLDNNHAFSDALGNKTGAYLLSDLLDTTGKNTSTPYVDVILFATASIVAGADANKSTARNGDVPIHFYVDEVADYNPALTYDPQSTDPNHLTNCLAKFFDATKVAASAISNYVLKGSDLALEVMVENSGGANKDTGTTYWSLKKAIENSYYDQEIDRDANDPGCGRVVKLMSEVAIVGGLTMEGNSPTDVKKRTLDVNSFDVQVANNTTSGKGVYAEGMLLRNAWLTLADKSNTTGSELAIGNNARFVIEVGAKLIIDATCQMEIEWDGATTTPGTTQTPDTLNNGQLDLRAGGEVVNNGIITIEGTEGKPYQPEAKNQASNAEKGFGEFQIEPGATFTNNGALMVYGALYNLGTLVNNGKYDDLIVSNDPDKGRYAYHKGIQIAWKDDVTQNGVVPGSLYNGRNRNGAVYTDALLLNNGDILVNPGTIYNYGKLINERGANIFLGVVTEAIIPIEPTVQNPTVQSKRIQLPTPVSGTIENYGTIINKGNIVPVSVAINDDGSFGELFTPGNFPELFGFPQSNNHGTVVNCGYIYGWQSKSVFLADGTVKPIRCSSGSSRTAVTAATLPATGDSPAPLYALVAMLVLSLGVCLVVRRRSA